MDDAFLSETSILKSGFNVRHLYSQWRRTDLWEVSSPGVRWGKLHLVVSLPLDYFWGGYGRKEVTEKHWGLLSSGSETKNKNNSALNKQLQLDDFSAVSAVPIAHEPEVQVRSDAKYVVTGMIMFVPGFLLQLLSNYWISYLCVWLQWLMVAFPITAAFWFHFPGISTSNFIMKDSCFVILLYREKEELKAWTLL